MIHKYTNSLIHETSPYLLQHAHNPVNWYPWGEEALTKAIKENKPILVSIGYSACHWCHVMERESFEDEATAMVMNRDFINIKIDREERPDLDHIYMDAVQAMTGSGGWPLNVFLTPDRKPFYGGTYFPPQRAYNRPSWLETLSGVAQAFRERRHEIDAQAENLTAHLLQSNSFGMQKLGEDEIFTPGKIDLAADNLLKTADMEWGGFGRAPKFPQTQAIQFLLRKEAPLNPPKGGTLKSHNNKYPPEGKIHEVSGSEAPPAEGFGEASLSKMIEGGIYDQVGGGFARYATDTEWLVPHFEKMLYDNALLVAVLSEAYQLTGKERYKEVIAETIAFVQREMMNKEGGFYAALDADSEGVEGKFYVWSKKEVVELLGETAGIFCEYYDISEKGNWSEGAHSHQGINILRVKVPLEEFAILHKLDVKSLSEILNEGREKLLQQRETRIRPGTDDKVILGWNALMITACCKAFAATGVEDYRQLAITNANFILQHMRAEPAQATYGIGLLFHTWKEGKAKVPAFLDDYAFFIQALIHLQEITTETAWLEKATELTAFVITHFSEAETGFFYYTPKGQADVIIQKKEVYDGATPSGNAVMADNLWRLGLLTDQKLWQQRAMDMVATLGNAITRYPSSFGTWACLLQEMVAGTNEIAIVGPAYKSLSEQVLKHCIPHKVMMAAEHANSAYPLLLGRDAGEKTGIYLCRNYTCAAPVFSTEELISLINKAQKQE